MIGECGRRGGYFECHNIDEDIKQQLYKLASISLCPSVQGQVMVDLIVNPPRKGDESFDSYTKEVSDIYGETFFFFFSHFFFFFFFSFFYLELLFSFR